MKIIRTLSTVFILTVLVLGVLYGYFIYTPAPDPSGPGADIRTGSLKVGELERTYLCYVPKTLETSPALFIVLHGSVQTSETIRTFTGYAFDRLADEKHCVVVYPQGIEKNWNDCRKAARYPARTRNIDDKGFLKALIARMVKAYGVDEKRVFVAGYSNGGHLGFRLALEMPESFAGIAAIAANLPTPDNCDCEASGKPAHMLLINGTKDPLNPFDGGTVSLFGIGNRGTVYSSHDSANYFADLAGYTENNPGTQTLVPEKPGQNAVTLRTWHKPGGPRVGLYSIEGGGHVIPQPFYRAPRLFGKNSPEFNSPQAIWDFFNP